MSAASVSVSVAELREIALARMAAEKTPEGNPLDPLNAALIDLAVKAQCTALDAVALAKASAAATAAGATIEQQTEVMALLSGLGMHTQMALAPLLAKSLPEGPLDAERQALWDEKVGNNPYWKTFEGIIPGFLDALLRVSPLQFKLFFEMGAAPWHTRTVRAITKELLSLAVDASPAHRFMPGFLLHLGGSLSLGAGRSAILGALDIAAQSPPHSGFRTTYFANEDSR